LTMRPQEQEMKTGGGWWFLALMLYFLYVVENSICSWHILSYTFIWPLWLIFCHAGIEVCKLSCADTCKVCKNDTSHGEVNPYCLLCL
jgi:hypothetical protein